MSEKPFDIVIFGATSFVGQILADYMLEQFADDSMTWAMAGRSLEKLENLRQQLGSSAAGIPLIVADAGDDDALQALCEQARVVVSTVGPYALYGEPLVRACVESGTHYCDLTGEVIWIKRMLDKYEEGARQSGARIIHCCGFDSMPSDLGVLFLQGLAEERFGRTCTTVDMRVGKFKGAFSGGTIASMINMTKEAAKDPALRKELADPYSICPAGHGFRARQLNVKSSYDEAEQSWIAPFVMAAVNTRVVHRSNALSGNRYGDNFLYSEAMLTGDGGRGKRRSRLVMLGMSAFMVGVALPPSRWFLQRFFLPEPGEGPTPEQQRTGGYEMFFNGVTDNGEVVRAKVTGDRDPGYGSTAKMLGQAAACLAFDIERAAPGGFWTPATLLGDELIKRLQAHSGLTFEALD